MLRKYYLRIKLLFFIFIFLFLGLLVRLLQLQIVEGEELAALAERIRTQTVFGEEFPRGDILDRNGESLLDSREQPAVVIFPAMWENSEQAIVQLSRTLGIRAEKIQGKLELAQKYHANGPFILHTNLSEQELSELNELDIPGVYVVPIKSRYGPESLAVHLIGHLNSIDGPTWERLKKEGRGEQGLDSYLKSDVIGVKGLEAQYESYLRATQPEYYLEATVDAKGQLLSGLGFKKIETFAAKERNNLILTIDKNIQKAVEEVMDKRVKKGAVVVLDVNTGEVLAMASRPVFDQNNIAEFLTPDGKDEHEFVNRALEHYYPGSIFKTIIAAAALEEGIAHPEQKYICSGKYVFPTGLTIPCWKKEGHGQLSLTEALAQSCNPIFIEIGLKLGREKILEYVQRFGLKDEVLLGYRLNKFTSFNIEPNSPGAIGNAVLGQQGVMLSPLQVASVMATIANQGVYLQPRVVERIETGANQVVKSWETPPGQRAITSSTAEKVKTMLTAVTTEGTGKKAWLGEWGAAGKTSTAQTGIVKETGAEIVNGWFAGFAPLQQPKYAVAVMIEDAIAGGIDAAPVFKEIMEKILSMER